MSSKLLGSLDRLRGRHHPGRNEARPWHLWLRCLRSLDVVGDGGAVRIRRIVLAAAGKELSHPGRAADPHTGDDRAWRHRHAADVLSDVLAEPELVGLVSKIPLRLIVGRLLRLGILSELIGRHGVEPRDGPRSRPLIFCQVLALGGRVEAGRVGCRRPELELTKVTPGVLRLRVAAAFDGRDALGRPSERLRSRRSGARRERVGLHAVHHHLEAHQLHRQACTSESSLSLHVPRLRPLEPELRLKRRPLLLRLLRPEDPGPERPSEALAVCQEPSRASRVGRRAQARAEVLKILAEALEGCGLRRGRRRLKGVDQRGLQQRGKTTQRTAGRRGW